MLKVLSGFTDLLPDKAMVFCFVKEKLNALFQSFGFLPIVPPSVEVINTFTLSGEEESDTFNFIDHREGKTSCFRYDFTPQIARIIKNYSIGLPQKFCYDGVVLRNPKQLSGERREIYQAGVEIIGESSIFADIELILLSREIFNNLGIDDFKIFISDIRVIKAIFTDGKGNTLIPDKLRRCFVEKNLSEIEKILQEVQLSEEKKVFLKELPLFCGDIKMIESIISDFKIKEITPYLKRLVEIGKFVQDAGVTVHFDLGEVRGFNYHSGIIIDCYVADEFKKYHEVITGGRYDHLLENYLQKPVAATGFAVDLLTLIEVVNYDKPLSIFILCNCANKMVEVFKIAENLRKTGIKVFLAYNKEGNLETLEEIEKNFGFKLIVEEKKAKIIFQKSGEEKTLKNLSFNFVNSFIKDMVK